MRARAATGVQCAQNGTASLEDASLQALQRNNKGKVRARGEGQFISCSDAWSPRVHPRILAIVRTASQSAEDRSRGRAGRLNWLMACEARAPPGVSVSNHKMKMRALFRILSWLATRTLATAQQRECSEPQSLALELSSLGTRD